MINELITALSQELELSAKEIADTIWLALQMDQFSAEDIDPQPPLKKGELEQPPLKKGELEQPLKRGELEQPPLKKGDSEKRTIKQSPQEQKAGIYPRNDSSKSSGLSIRVPDASSLREPLMLARALKPLMRRVASGRELVLDEVATIQQIADQGLWIPILKPTLEPWLDLDLVVDESISMQIWRHTIKELERLLKNYGIFRDVRVWGLMTDDNQQVKIRRCIGATAKNQSPRSPKELIDPSGRRLVLVVSDCVSSLWRSGKVTPVLEMWAKQGTMAIIQMLPKWMWKRTALGWATEVWLRALTPGVFNQHLIAQEVYLSWDEVDEERVVKVPVFTLERDRAEIWAQMLAGKGSIWTSGYLFKLDTANRKESGLFNFTGDWSAENRVQGFRVTASPMARKLAGLLASAPVITLPIVRLIQETFLKDSLQVNVAEVFLGGLLKPLSEINAETNPDSVQYGFMDGVRELLLDSVPSDYVLNVIDEVSKYVAKKLGLSVADFAAVLKKEQPVRNSEIVDEFGYFATVTAQVLRRLGGEYAKFAEELEGDNRVDLQTNVQTIEPLPDIKYHLGGCLGPDETSYIKRQADEDLYNALKAGELCVIYAPAQMGKSSLILQVMNRLKNEDFACAYIDLSMFGSGVDKNSFQNFCYSLIETLVSEFALTSRFNLREWWKGATKWSSTGMSFRNFIDDILTEEINQDIIIFIDEIDYLIVQDFTADFLSLLRGLYERNKFKQNNKLKCNFVLSGRRKPNKNNTLILNTSPFNVGVNIELKEFTYEEALPLAGGLAEKTDNPQELLKSILQWTGGQPFLTQKICSLVKESKQSIPNGTEKDWLDNLVRTQIIENWEFYDKPQHFRSITDRILYDQKPEVLSVYESILQGEGNFDKRSNYEALPTLMSTGLVIRHDGKLKVANKIYESVFDREWIAQNLAKIVVLNKKVVVLRIETGNFEQGFSVTLTIGREGEPFSFQMAGVLPPAPDIPQYYTDWQHHYNLQGYNKLQEIHNAANRLSENLNHWLNSQSFTPIRGELLKNLLRDDEVRIIIQTENMLSIKLPWHLWNFFDTYRKAEVVLATSIYKQPSQFRHERDKNVVRILAILGDDRGIDLTKDRDILQQLPNAEIVALCSPDRQQINEQIWVQDWDILSFSGSYSQNVGKFYINTNDSLTISDLNFYFNKAIEKGLQLAIFNCCNGIELAQDLEHQGIPLIVMRESLPDIVAQKFLEYFMAAFSQGKSLHLAVREARERLQAIENQFPCASWLPVIVSNPVESFPTWESLRGISLR
jgi:AAA-like domain